VPFLLGCALLAGEGSVAGMRGRSPAGREKPGWKLAFADEFDGTALDRSKWNDRYWDGRTHSNNELEYYAPDGYEVSGGLLRLKGEKRRMGGREYTSGMITSLGKFAQQYGWFEIRAKFPKGKGFWPAFWLLPVTKQWPPEIDVLEILGHEPDKVYFSTHWRDAAGRHRFKTQSYRGPDFSQEFHTFAVEWKPGEVIWYVDGQERARSQAGVPAEPMYVIANLAVGGDWPGNPDRTTPFPGVMEIDAILVYRRQEERAGRRIVVEDTGGQRGSRRRTGVR
jgi:beta-glucanase (GH16 family)